MSEADESVPGLMPPPKLTKGPPGSFAGLLGQAGVAASSAAAGAAAGASAAASITAKRHSIAPASDKSGVVRSASGEISSLQEQGKLYGMNFILCYFEKFGLLLRASSLQLRKR